eukprot:4469695-Pyramimonas_sp.AAC.1
MPLVGFSPPPKPPCTWRWALFSFPAFLMPTIGSALPGKASRDTAPSCRARPELAWGRGRGSSVWPENHWTPSAAPPSRPFSSPESSRPLTTSSPIVGSGLRDRAGSLLLGLAAGGAAADREALKACTKKHTNEHTGSASDQQGFHISGRGSAKGLATRISKGLMPSSDNADSASTAPHLREVLAIRVGASRRLRLQPAHSLTSPSPKVEGALERLSERFGYAAALLLRFLWFSGLRLGRRAGGEEEALECIDGRLKVHANARGERAHRQVVRLHQAL